MIRWACSTPRMRRNGGLFCLGDVVPSGYFTEAEIADLVSRGKVKVIESKQVEIGSAEPQAPELVEPQAPELVEPQAPELEQHEEFEQHEEHEEHEEPIDLGAVEDRPKAKAKRGRKS